MRLSRWLGVLLAAPLAYGQQHGLASAELPDSFSQLVTELPTCSINCLLSLVKISSCNITDVACLCGSKDFQDAATKCVRASCKLSESLLTKNVTENACQRPIRDSREGYSTMNIATGTIPIVFVTARLLFKQFFSRSKRVGADDIVIAGAVAIGIPGMVVNQIGLIGHGLGKDVWTIPPTELPEFAMYFFMMEIIYLVEISLIKLSLSLFYLYVFPGTTIQRLLLGTAIFNVVFGVVFVIVAIFQCTPVEYSWTQYSDVPPQGHCIRLNQFAWSNAAMSLAVDLWMIALPISQIRKLDLHWKKKKIGVTIMFLIGTFVTVISLLRLKSVIYFVDLINPTWDQWNVAWWSTLEVNIGIVCTCLPTMRIILVRLFPRLFGTDESRTRAAVSSRGPSTINRGSTLVTPYVVGWVGRGSSMELSTTSTVNYAKSSEKPFDAV